MGIIAPSLNLRLKVIFVRSVAHVRRSLGGCCTPGTTISSLFVLYMPHKAVEGLIAVTTVGTAFEAAEEPASFLRSLVLPLNMRERQLGGVCAAA
jgi:hypothetical protein